jgi:MFS family permease
VLFVWIFAERRTHPAEVTLNTDIAPSPQQERANYHKLVVEVAWFGLAVASTSRFLSVYAIRLGATPAELGWMTALPFMVLLCSTALSPWWRRHYSDSIKAIFWPSLGFRFVFLLPAFTPLFPPPLQPMWLIMAVALPALPQGISSTIFVGMLREAVPGNKLVRLASARNLWMNLMIALAALGFGIWLEHAPFPINYQVMFLAAFALALISHWYVMRIRVDAVAMMPQPPQVKSSAQPLRSPLFLRAVVIGVIIHIGFMSIVPVTPLHLVENLGANEGFMALFGIAELAAAALVCVFTDRLSARLGHRRLVGLAMLGTMGAALVMAAAHNLPVTLIGAALSGASWTAAAIGLYGLFTESTNDVPLQDMTRYTTVYHQIIYVAAFLGPMIGSNLANGGMNLVAVMLIGAGLRFMSGVTILQMETLVAAPVQALRKAYRRL